MTAQWNSNIGGAQNAAGDQVNQNWGAEGPRLVKGVWSAITKNADSGDPSTGAPIAWGSREVGTEQVQIQAAVTDHYTRRWMALTSAPTYGWRDLGLRKMKYIADPTLAVVVLAPASPLAVDTVGVGGWIDVNLATTLNGATPGDVQDAGQLTAKVVEVVLQVEVTADAAEVITNPAKGYIAFRAKGAANQEQRVYAQVAGRPMQQQVIVQLDASEIMQFKVVVGTGAPNFAFSAKIVEIRERV